MRKDVKNSLRSLVVAVLAALTVSSQAAIAVYETFMDGPSEAPPNASPGTGWSVLTFDTTAMTMRLEASFTGLTGTTTAAHIHAPTAVAGVGTASVATQVPSFVGFPLGVTSGVYDNTFDMTLTTSYNGSFITNNGGTTTAAFAALMSYVDAGRAYLNIHSSTFGGGEIRGFYAPVPEPMTLAVIGLGAAALVRKRARRRA